MRRARSVLLHLLLAMGLAIPTAGATEPDAPEAEARAHFENGVALLRDDALADALAEFQRSRALFPTAKATVNAAVCLRRLGRFDEALDMVDALLSEFPDLPPEKVRAAQTEREEIAKRVGTLILDGGPAGARVSIDGRDRGALPSATRLRVSAGSRLVRVDAEGFQPFEQRMDVAAQTDTSLTVTLAPAAQPSPSPPLPSEPPTPEHAPAPEPRPPQRAHPFFVELDGMVLIARGWSGSIYDGCMAHCVASRALGGYGVARGGYTFPFGLGLGFTLGGLGASQSLMNRPTMLYPLDHPSHAVTVDDQLTLRGLVAGAWIGYSLGDRVRGQVRLGAGVLLGTRSDARSGTFPSSGGPTETLEPAEDTSFAIIGLIEPEIRVAFRVSERIELSAGLEVPFFLPANASGWDASQTVTTSIDGPARFGAATFFDGVRVMFAPGLGARYAF